MKKIYGITITLFIVGLALSGSITLVNRRAFAREELAKNAADRANQVQGPMPVRAEISVRANGQGRSQLVLGDAREMSTAYTGAESKRELENQSTRPLSLAAGDVDEDGVPDLVSGYAGRDANLLVIHRGNVDAIYADTPEANESKALGTFTDAPFLSPVMHVRRVLFTIGEKPLQIVDSYYRADKFHYSVHLVRVQDKGKRSWSQKAPANQQGDRSLLPH